MKKLSISLLALTLLSPVEANVVINTALMLAEEEESAIKSDVFVERKIYIHKTKKMTASYNHTWFYDYEVKKYLKQKTTPNVKAKDIMIVKYNVTQNKYVI